MSILESLNKSTKSIIEKGKTITIDTIEYYKLKAFYTITYSLSFLLKAIIIGGFLALGTVFLSIALAVYLGTIFNNFYYGFILVGLLYVLFGLIAFLFRKKIDVKLLKFINKKAKT